MLKPYKFMSLKLSIVNISSIIIKYMRKYGKLPYDILYSMISEDLKEESKEVFAESLIFLYALGVIEYIENDDSLELIK